MAMQFCHIMFLPAYSYACGTGLNTMDDSSNQLVSLHASNAHDVGSAESCSLGTMHEPLLLKVYDELQLISDVGRAACVCRRWYHLLKRVSAGQHASWIHGG